LKSKIQRTQVSDQMLQIRN